MRRIWLIFVLVSYVSFASVGDVRSQFPNITSLQEINEHIDNLKAENSPDAKAYLAALYFLKSREVKFPLTKLKFFNKGKRLLDEQINRKPLNIEYRYLRLLFQHQIPSFLKYNQFIKSDFKVFKEEYKNSLINSTFKIKMVNNLMLSDKISTDNRELLIKIKSD